MNPIDILKAKKILENNGVKNYIIQDSGVIIRDRFFRLDGLKNNIEEIPFKLEKIYGDFSVQNLKSVANFPKEVDHSIILRNVNIKSFKNFPIKCFHEQFTCYNCALESLVGFPKFGSLPEITSGRSIDLRNNNLTSLKGLPKDMVSCDLNISENPIKEIDSIEYIDKLEFSDNLKSFGTLKIIDTIIPHISSSESIDNLLKILEKTKTVIYQIELKFDKNYTVNNLEDIREMFVSKGYNHTWWSFSLNEVF